MARKTWTMLGSSTVSHERATASCNTRNPVLSSACFLFQTAPSSGLEKHSCALIYPFFFVLNQNPSFFQSPQLWGHKQQSLSSRHRAARIVLRDLRPSPAHPAQRRSKQLKSDWHGLRNCPFILSDLYYYILNKSSRLTDKIPTQIFSTSS